MWLTAFLDFPAEAHRRAAEFWAETTGSALSASRGEHGEFATLAAPDSDDWLRVQRIDGPPRVHLDLHDLAPLRLRDRAIGLGARLVSEDVVPVLASPGGMTFCTVAGHEWRPPRPRSWGGHRSLVDQVCLDIPGEDFDHEAAFWSALLERPAFGVGDDRFARLEWHAGDSLKVLLQRTATGGPVRAHLDMACDDREAEVRRLLGMGAREVRRTPEWTTLADPAGLEFCVTDRAPEEVR